MLPSPLRATPKLNCETISLRPVLKRKHNHVQLHNSRSLIVSLTGEDGGGVVLGVVGAETPAAELVLHLERAVLFCLCVRDVLALAADGGVRPALGVEAVGAADQEVVRIRLGQHPDVVLTLVLRKRWKMLFFSMLVLNFGHSFMK